MWIIKTLNCFKRGHTFLDVKYRSSTYKYCLHCGKVEYPDHSHISTKNPELSHATSMAK